MPDAKVYSPNRDEIRKTILAGRAARGIVINFQGAEIEIRQMKVSDLVEASQGTDNEQSAIINTLIKSAYVPGTDEKVFTSEDADAIKSMPWGPDFSRLAEAFRELTEGDFRPKEGSAKPE